MDRYEELARELVDYITTCNRHRAVPLKHDVNYYSARLRKAEKEERGAPCGYTSSAR